LPAGTSSTANATTTGARARREFQRRIPGQAAHYRFAGLDLGFTYERGAFIPEPSEKPEADDPVVDYRPTTWPSARLPHFWVFRDGERLAIHDLLAHDAFTLLTHSGADHAWRLAADAIRNGPLLPLRHFSIGRRPPSDLADEEGRWPNLSEVDPSGAVLVRPDGHVAWRTLTLPASPRETLALVLERVLCLP
jgi:2,4-dichlorophenol 6-monooxygenase